RGREGRDEETERCAEQRVEERHQEQQPGTADDVEPEEPHRQTGGEGGLDDREGTEGEGVAGDQVALAERHGEETFEGAGGPLAQGRDRGDQEHRDQREDAEERGADVVEGARAAVEDVAEQEQHQAGHDEQQRDGAGVVAQLAQDPAGGGEGAGRVEGAGRGRGAGRAGAGGRGHRVVSFERSAAAAWSTRCRKASSTVSAPVRERRASGVTAASSGRAVSPVSSAPARIRRRLWQRSASSITWEEISRLAFRSAAMPWNSSQRSRRRTGSRPT